MLGSLMLGSACEPGPDNRIVLPQELEELPFVDGDPLLKNVKRIILSDATYPYNGSIISIDDGFLLAYRFVTDSFLAGAAETEIRVVKLDKNFVQLEPSRVVKIDVNFPEDPRLFRMNNKICLAFNATKENHYGRRVMFVGELSGLENFGFEVSISAHDIEFESHSDQKNWVPFVAEGQLYFGYSLNPHTILAFNEYTKQVSALPNETKGEIDWKYGHIRGGTPAIRWGDEYLAFFHSSFQSGSLRWYVMGAYTFESKPPFRVTRISEKPIMLRDFYTTRLQPIVNKTNRVVFPSGLVIEDGIIYISYGENDSAVKILEMEESELAKTLRNVTAK